MTGLVFLLFPTLLFAAVEAGCSSSGGGATQAPSDAAAAIPDGGGAVDSSVDSGTVLSSYDSGPIVVPDAAAGGVTVIVAGNGVVVSADGTPSDGGFVGVDGGSPIVDCPSLCTAPQGITLYALPSQGSTFVGWSVGGSTLSTDDSIAITGGLGSPLTATFTM